MTTKDLVVIVKSGKHIINTAIHMDEKGTVIYSLDNIDLIMPEINVLNAIAFVKSTMLERGIVAKPDYIVSEGVDLVYKYKAHALKRLEDISLSEFNEMMKQYHKK